MVRQRSGWIAASVLALVVVTAVLAFARGWIGLHSIRAAEALAGPAIAHHPIATAAIAFLLCIIAFALSFPVAPLIGIAAGALFGFWPALLLVWPAQTIGSTLAFLGTRRWLKGFVSRRLARRIAALESDRRSTTALLAIRLNPLIPYWPVNLALGATDLPTGRFALITAIGLLPATLVYAEAGTRLASLRSLGDIVSPALIGWMLLASLSSLAVGRARHVLRSWLGKRGPVAQVDG